MNNIIMIKCSNSDIANEVETPSLGYSAHLSRLIVWLRAHFSGGRIYFACLLLFRRGLNDEERMPNFTDAAKTDPCAVS